jgi:3-hydroxyacyl-CoA dehydrogenase/3a,7a,12a-trihydroxy-5b-cholest-24-enoyl-CoA hydratase
MSEYHVDPTQIVGYAFAPTTYSYTERDVSLYALGVGAGADPLDARELRYVYELSGDGFVTLPTFGVVFASQMIVGLLSGDLPGLRFNPMLLLHGEQRLDLARPLPARASVTLKPVISAVYDKGSGALVIIDVPAYDDRGELLALNQSSMFIRGIGGFGGERGASEKLELPTREPDQTVEQATLAQQALLYRLSGDTNPLHADPALAAAGGFARPILHGLCTLGFAGRAALNAFCGGEPARFKSIRGRFTRHVFPGETLITRFWRENGRVLYESVVKERGDSALMGVIETA